MKSVSLKRKSMITFVLKKRIPGLSVSYSILITLEYSAYCIFQQLESFVMGEDSCIF